VPTPAGPTSPSAPVDTRERHVYEPVSSHVTDNRHYWHELWTRRHFALELSRAEMDASHSNTVFGRLWLLLNPVLTASVYFLLVVIIGGGRKGPDYFVHLLGALFAFHLLQGAMTAGSQTVVGGGKLVLNTSFPLLLLPLAALRTAVSKFLPTMAIFFAFFTYFAVFAPKTDANTLHFSPYQLLAIPAFALLVVFTAGMTLLMATAQVYFRDVSNFLPYVTRMWMYLSPVLYFAWQMKPWMLKFEVFNPIFAILAVWGETLVRGDAGLPSWWLMAAAWAFGTFAIGLFVFRAKEREFPVRL
jgi:teichoic acid transport system permease protein